ncbi:alpha/beta-hydrolase [Exidia glandulosa HHB12029]|uniref:Alpha/beta-hydrolase n=1 Tax=Exidia glandulosa HHB12029 TaxID=1314781 RepID=A0A166BQ26_EXIGL|nr:alpha/beta-hydrolase [Exidia glandulosa HHB12029]
MSLCKDCVVAVTHDGTPTGKIQTVGGVETYLALPANEDYPKDKAIIFCADLFGIKFVNNQVQCDDFARALGIAVYAPDYLHDDAVTDAIFGDPSWDIARDWLPRHTAAQTRPPLDALIASLKAQGVSKFGATGYCFGGRYALDLAQNNAVHVAIISHPSLLKVPEDFVKLLEKSTVPLLVNSCEVDPVFGSEAQEATDRVLGEGKYEPGYERTYWPGCTHGFAVRGDMNDPLVKAGKEGAFKASVDWFAKHL